MGADRARCNQVLGEEDFPCVYLSLLFKTPRGGGLYSWIQRCKNTFPQSLCPSSSKYFCFYIIFTESLHAQCTSYRSIACVKVGLSGSYLTRLIEGAIANTWLWNSKYSFNSYPAIYIFKCWFMSTNETLYWQKKVFKSHIRCHPASRKKTYGEIFFLKNLSLYLFLTFEPLRSAKLMLPVFLL